MSNRMMRKLLCGLMVAAAGLGAGAPPRPAGAAPGAGTTFTVNSTLDEIDSNPADGLCLSTPSGRCTLRAAIMQANTTDDLDTVILPAGTYTLTRPGFDVNGATGDLDVAKSLVLQGAGSGKTIVDGNRAVTSDRVIHVLSTSPLASLRGLTIRNGLSFDGGGLYFEGYGPLVLTDVVVEHNQAETGGGINIRLRSQPYVLSLNHVILRDNTATQFGGGLAVVSMGNSGFVYVYNSEIYSNTAALGGGILTEGDLTAVNSRLRNNHATTSGGAVLNYGIFGALQTTVDGNTADKDGGALDDGGGFMGLINSTLAANGAGRYGGAIYAAGGHLELYNATVAGNWVQFDHPTQIDLGGGVFLTQTVTFDAQNSIVANNTRYNPRVAPQLDDCSSHDSVGGMHYNLFTTLAHCSYVLGGGQSNNLEGQDPLLGPLQDNGGPTPTEALLPGSPAIDAGDPAGCTDDAGHSLATDQRGAPRTDAHCDMGAYEAVPEADMAVGVRDHPDPARVGAALTYAVVVTNTGPDTASGVVLTDTFSISATFGAATPSQGSCAGTATFVCRLGSMPSGGHATLTLKLTPTAAGTITDTATTDVNEFDGFEANNTAAETTAVLWGLDLPVVRR
jgi:uncharacterized repeat protein (TIGR01451 family)/CSLREA domain-containing protein